jgi:D-alanine-D-alanine ligase-like ATP-grasp enzyme
MPLTLFLPKPAPCPECGYEAIYHGVEFWSAVADAVITPLTFPLWIVGRSIEPVAATGFDWVAPRLARLLKRAGLAVLVDRADGHTSETAQCLWEEARARGISLQEVRLFGLPRRLFVAEFRGRSCAFEGLPRPSRRQPSILWLDDKAKLKRRFARQGFPIARGGVALTSRQALRIFRTLAPPVVLKPRRGSNGRHTTVHIETEAELLRAYRSARRICPWVVIEEELKGPVFRVTLVGGKVAGVLRRDPPHVIGDGVRTVRALAEIENKNPLRRGPVFSELSAEAPAACSELSRQGYTPYSVPAAGQIVYLHFKVNWGVGGISYDVTDEVHPENTALFESIGTYVRDDIVGLDVIVESVGRSWKEQERAGVIEANTLPHIGNHHFPYRGPVRNVAGAVWNLVFQPRA